MLLAELDLFCITNGNRRFWNFIFSIIGTMVVKITDDNAKAQVQKRLNRKLAFNRINSYCLLFFSTIHVAGNHENGFLWKGLRNFIDACFFMLRLLV
jgi:UDP-N-acetylmuramyl pentapeptide phosphotransferase/UDP-N-acetylglucosamine-1-phosphate transferase